MSEKRLATILLVEDEASDADLICRGFAKAKVRRIPVVVLTSDRESATMDAAYDLGANSYLVFA